MIGGLIGKGLGKGASKINKAAKKNKNKQEIGNGNSSPQPAANALDSYFDDQTPPQSPQEISTVNKSTTHPPPRSPDPPRRTTIV